MISNIRITRPGFATALRTTTLDWAFKALARIEHVVEVRRQRAMLARLDDRLLKDIGVSRSDAYRETSRGILDVPEPPVVTARRSGFAVYRIV